MPAGVPVVPIVIHTASEALPKGGFFVPPATVHVDMLWPIAAGVWSAASVERHVAEVRECYRGVLGQRAGAAPARLARIM